MGGAREPKVDILTGSYSRQRNANDVTLIKFGTGFGLGVLGERFGNVVGPNAMNDIGLKLLGETYNNVLINGPIEPSVQK